MMKELPTTKTNRKWSYIYAYNLKTLRDIFVYCSKKGKIAEKQLYADMARNIIPPPKTPWINKKVKRKERLRLEYIHAAEYLGLVKREKGIIRPNLDDFNVEKKIIIESNKNRCFKEANLSIDLNQKEKWALANIIFNYERARDYLFWFLNFRKYKNADSFNPNDFKKEGKPIFLSGRSVATQRGSNTLKRGADNKLYKIPYDYIRLVNYVFPNWFKEMGLIDKVVIFSEFSNDKNLWHMFYPVKISDEDFLNKNISKLLMDSFLKNTNKKRIWLPYLIYVITLKYGCSIKAIKLALEKVYKEDYEHFYLERTSLSLMKRHSQYEDSYLKVDGFFRSSLIITRRSNSDG